jgi:ERCC4-type nuclease
MLLLDDRTGSGDLLPALQSLVGKEVSLERLEFGDAAFVGNKGEEVVSVGIEIKTLSDMIQCILNGRFAGHQLPGLTQDFDYVMLIVEGEFRPDESTGVLQYLRKGKFWSYVNQGPRRFMYRELDKFFMTLEFKVGVIYRNTQDRRETAQVVADAYKWWQQGWDEHKSHTGFNRSRDAVTLAHPDLIACVAKELPGIGDKKARDAAAHFESVRAMINADVDEWCRLDGVGKTFAQRIVDAVTFKRPGRGKGGWKNG